MPLQIFQNEKVPGVTMAGAPSAVAVGDAAAVFTHGSEGDISYAVLQGDRWTRGNALPKGKSSFAPAAVSNPRIDKLQVFFQGPSSNGELRYLSGDIGKFEQGRVPSSAMSTSPAAVVHQNRLYVFYEGAREDGTLRFNSIAGDGWDVEKTVANTGTSGTPSVAVFTDSTGPESMYVFHNGVRNDTQVWFNIWNGSNWAGDTKVPRVFAPPTAINAVGFGAALYLFHIIPGVFTLGYSAYANHLWDDEVSKLPEIVSRFRPSVVVYQQALHGFYHRYDGSDTGELWHFRAQ
jgi:hypothetical protein